MLDAPWEVADVDGAHARALPRQATLLPPLVLLFRAQLVCVEHQRRQAWVGATARLERVLASLPRSLQLSTATACVCAQWAVRTVLIHFANAQKTNKTNKRNL